MVLAEKRGVDYGRLPGGAMNQGRVLREVRIDRILPAHFQAGQVFSDQVIVQLASSLKEMGQNTPVLLRPAASPSGTTDSEDWFELVCGECRVRAAKLLGWKAMWAVIEEMTDESAALRGILRQRHLSMRSGYILHACLHRETQFTESRNDCWM